MYDVIVIGAGPAGLSVASELAENNKVMVVDRKKESGDCNKSWFIPSYLVKDNPEVMSFMYPGIFRLLTHTFTDVKTVFDTRLPYGYCYVKEHEILKYWSEKAQILGADILLETSYVDHIIEKNHVLVETTAGTFKGRLLIDASGHDSLVSNKYKAQEDNYWWSVYGAIVEHPSGLHGMRTGDYMYLQTFKNANLKDDKSVRMGRPIFQYEVLAENESFPLIKYLRKEKVDKEFMEKEFSEILFNEQPTSQYRDCSFKEMKWGWYPSGGLSYKQAENRVVFIGDAGCWNTPCGWGFGIIVSNYKKFAESLTILLKDDTLDNHAINNMVHPNFFEKHQISIDALTSHFLANASPDKLDRFINFFNANNPDISEKIFTLTVGNNDLKEILKVFFNYFSPLELLEIVPNEDLFLLLKETDLISFGWIADEIKEVQEPLYLLSNTLSYYKEHPDIQQDIRNLFISTQKILELLVMKREELSNAQTKLAHYTRQISLKHLFKRFNESKKDYAKLRLNNASYMNDPSEGVVLLDYLKNCFKSNELLLECCENMGENRPNDLKQSDVYLFSLTSNIDGLPMWAQYGELGKGSCLVFDNAYFDVVEEKTAHDFFTQSNDTTAIEKQGVYAPYRVQYIDKGNCITDINNDKIRLELVKINSITGQLDRKCSDNLELRKHIIDDVIRNLEQIRFLFKSTDYAYEQELRLLRFVSIGSNMIQLDTSVEPVPKIFIERDCPIKYSEVIFGPKVESPDNIIPYIKYVDGEVAIRKSTVKFR